MVEGLTLRKCEKEDLPRISDFRKYVFLYNPNRSCEPEYYEWKCWKNPMRLGEMWLAESGNTVVGMKSMTPKRVKILEAIVDGAETGDTFTHPDYQRRGIFTGLFKAARENGLDARISFIYGLPNENSLAGYEKRLDYAQIPIRLRGLIKPIFPRQILKKMLTPPFLTTMFSPMLEVASRVIFRIGTRGIAKSDVSVHVEQNFPNDIDTLWEQTSKNYDVMLVRTRDYLEWRYVTNPDAYSILVARNSDGAILGYMVTKVGFYEDMPIGFVVDFLTLEDDPGIFKKLLATAIEGFYQRKVSFVLTYAVKGNFYDKILLRTGFLPRGNHYIICYKNEVGNQVPIGNYKWHFTMGDSDNI